MMNPATGLVAIIAANNMNDQNEDDKPITEWEVELIKARAERKERPWYRTLWDILWF